MIVNRIIRSSECNFNAELSLNGIVDIVQDLITETLKEVGCDNITLRNNYHAMWVYTKNKIHVEKSVKWSEEITVECRSVKSNRLLNYMNTNFFNKDNEIIISSIVEMCVLDINSNRFIRLTDLPFNCNNQEMDPTFYFDEVTYSNEKPFVVSPMMIDYSMHLNNTHSIHLFLESLNFDELKMIFSHSYDFIIRYNSQAHYLDKLVLKTEKKDNHFYFCFEKENEKIVSQGELIVFDK